MYPGYKSLRSLHETDGQRFRTVLAYSSTCNLVSWHSCSPSCLLSFLSPLHLTSTRLDRQARAPAYPRYSYDILGVLS